MSTVPEAGATWPFPGLVWGDYPQRQLPLAPQPREGAWGREALESFAREAVRSRFDTAGADCISAALLRACAALELDQGVSLRWQQVMAARALLGQKLVEMDTGEGKTFAVALAAGAAALAGTPVHVVTANDYLAVRDAQALASYYAALGLACGHVTQPMEPAQRKRAYACHVTYVTGKELAFDYLRDALQAPATGSALQQRLARMQEAGAAAQRVLRGLCFAILDEADTMLIDEARIPMVLAQARGHALERGFLQVAWSVAAAMVEGVHFRISADAATARLLPPGRALVAQWPQEDFHFLLGHPAHRESTVALALAAMHLLHKGRDYVVREGKVALVDESTGRLSPGRAWSRGLHQFIEIKESLALTDRNETVSQVTFQRFFARYLRLAGISGTLREACTELRRVYGLSLVRVERHEPRRVTRFPARLFPETANLWDAVAARAASLAHEGRPVLVGVNTVAQSQEISQVLARNGVAHQLLNANHDAEEQAVLAGAGAAGVVTVATSMAGRGSDILLDEAALRAGGLHVILCQLNRSARVDRQFLGRAGRQGQPGSTEHWLAGDFAGFAPVPVWLRRAWTSNKRPAGLSLSLFLRIFQAVRTYTDMKQRVNLLRIAEAEERDYAFSRDQLI